MTKRVLYLPACVGAVPRMKDVVTTSQATWPEIAQRGQDFVMRNLTMEALHCYW